MKKLICIICATLLLSVCNAQCNLIELNSQSEVDSFIYNYGACKNVNTLFIYVGDNEINNLDSLYFIESVVDLTFLGDSLESLSGMTSLRRVNSLNMRIKTKGLDPFLSLDTIIELNHDYYDSGENLFLYSEVKYIGTLNLRNNGLFSGLWNFEPHSGFGLQIFGNESGDDIAKILKGHSGRLAILSLSQQRGIGTKNLDITSLSDIDTIDALGLHGINNIDLSPILDVSSVKNLFISNDDGMNLREGFGELRNLEFISVFRTSRIKSLSEVVPNIESVKHRILISSNDSLESIDVLSDLPPLERTTFDEQNADYLYIVQNPRLEFCNNPFICDAIEQFESPDSLSIYLNGKYCTYDSLINVSCLTVPSDDRRDVIIVSPNPTNGLIEVGLKFGNYYVYDIRGRNMAEGRITQGNINIDGLSNGVYILRLESDGKEEVHTSRIIKQ